MNEDYTPMSLWEIRDKSEDEKMKIINEWRIKLLTKIYFLEKVEIERLKEKKNRMAQRLKKMPELLAKAQEEYQNYLRDIPYLEKERDEIEDKFHRVETRYYLDASFDTRQIMSKKLNDYMHRLYVYVNENIEENIAKEWKQIDVDGRMRRQFYDGILDEKQVMKNIRKYIELQLQQGNELNAPYIEQAIRRYRATHG